MGSSIDEGCQVAELPDRLPTGNLATRQPASAMDLTQLPPALTQRQRLTLGIVALVCAATRLLALARSLWDWDEALFCLGMRSYDVTAHHPQPPGFPVYIALGRIARTVIPSDFRALQ